MKRILQITESLRRNGTETFLMNVFRNLDRKHFMFDFLVFTDETEGYFDEAVSLGARIFRLPKRSQNPFKYGSNIDKFFKEHSHEFAAVALNGCSLTDITPLYHAYRHGISIRICHAHSVGTHGIHNRILHNLHKLFIGNIATDFLGCSQSACRYFFGQNSGSKVIKNGIDLEKFRPDLQAGTRVREELGIGKESIFGHIGHFDTVKNHSFLLDVFRKIVDLKEDSILILIGEGPLKAEMQKKAVSLGLEKNVLFLGFREDVAKLIQSFDVFLFPSLYEGLGLVLIEAQTAGIPIVASNTIQPEAIISPRLKTLPLESPSEWAAEAIDLCANGRYEITSDIIAQGFDIIDTVKMLESIYNR